MVEDNSINQLIASKFLYKWGAEINFAENGLIGVDKVKNKYREQILISNKLIKLLKIAIVLFLIILIKINFLLN